MLDLLPDLVLQHIAERLQDETTFRDKYDIAIDAASLSVVGSQSCTFLANAIREKNTINKQKFISARTARVVWGICDSELEKLPAKLVVSSDSSLSFVKLYKQQSVKLLSSLKFGDDPVKLYKFKAQSFEQSRFDRLKVELDKFGVPFRADSRLVYNYIVAGTGDAVAIAKTLLELKFLYAQPNFNRYMAYYTAKYKREYGYYDKADIFNDAKQRALLEARVAKKCY